MARPIRDGIDYFSFDTDFFADDKIKLIRSEFGAKGIIILIYLLCEIYRGNGYYKIWDEDSCILVSDGAACGCSPEFTSQVIKRCVKRSLFNEGLFNGFQILTSPSIQRRYLRACSTRDEIRIKSEYWLLDVDNKKDVPSSILKKITFTNESLQNNPINLQINSINLQNNPQSKVKESKVKESKESGAKAPTLTDIISYCEDNSFIIDPERFFNYYESNGWVTSQGRSIVNWKATANNWNKKELKHTKEENTSKKPSTFSLDELDELDVFNT